MCGLFGVIRTESLSNKVSTSLDTDVTKLLRDACVVGSVRGTDSTGLLCVDQERNEYFSHKKVVSGPDFLADSAASRQFYMWSAYNLVAIHHRAATIGGITHKAAHPHNEGDIFLMHNGTLTEYTYHKAHKTAMTDSQTIAAAINEDGPEAISTLSGPMALVWYNGADKTIHLYRNKERPLAMATAPGLIIFASEKKMLEWLLSRQGIIPTAVGELKENCHMWIDSDYKTHTGIIESKPVYVVTSTNTSGNWNFTKNKATNHVNATGIGSGTNRIGLSEMFNCYMTSQHANVCKNSKSLINHGYKKGQDVVFWGSFQRMTQGGTFLLGHGVNPLPGYYITGDVSNVTPVPNGSDISRQWTGKLKQVFLHPKTQQHLVIVEDLKLVNGYLPSLPSPTKTTTPEPDDEQQDGVATVRGPGNRWISVARFKELTKYGCGFCQKDISINESNEIEWVNDDPICDSCFNGAQSKLQQ